MCAAWKKKNHEGYELDPRLTLSRINAAKTVDQAGNVGFSGWDYVDCRSILLTFTGFNDQIPQCDRLSVLRRGLKLAGKSGDITPNTAIAGITKAEAEYLAQPVRSFVARTSISVKYMRSMGSRLIGPSRIVFANHHPSRFGVKTIARTILSHTNTKVPADYASVRIIVIARTVTAAADIARESLDALRAIWNLFLNMRVGHRWSSRPNCVNDVVRGPAQTMHLPTGELATELFYYELYKTPMPQAVSLQEAWPKLVRFEERVKARLKRCAYQDILWRALHVYVEAMDDPDWHRSVLGLWKALELLTNTKRAQYDTLIRRATFLWTEPEFHAQMLQHIRVARNEMVHSIRSNDDAEALLFQLKPYVEAMFWFHLIRRQQFSDMESACNILDSSRDKKSLRQNIARQRRALRLLES